MRRKNSYGYSVSFCQSRLCWARCGQMSYHQTHTWLRIQVFARIPLVQEAAGTALKALGWCEGSVGLLALQLCELQTLCEY